MPKQKIQAQISRESITSNTAEAFALFEKSRFGEKKSGKILYSFSEALFLVEKNKLEIISGNKILKIEQIIDKLKRLDKKIQVKYPVFKDLREKGYIVKTALKFGADFRVYEKGIKPKQGHAKWIVFTDYETSKFNWNEFSAKNRVAHSTKKKLLLAIVDEESDVTYYEVSWIKP